MHKVGAIGVARVHHRTVNVRKSTTAPKVQVDNPAGDAGACVERCGHDVFEAALLK